ncbi:hypothetical protein U8V72_23345 [Priestia filamentosa]|uniref:hypothetical protein n=1 Tax=Priestia filamentosa TaxID=1402861 RepID=UPI00397C2292
MTTKQQILTRSQNFFKNFNDKLLEVPDSSKKNYEVNKEKLSNLELIDIYVDKKEDMNKKGSFHTFVHVFKLDENTELKVDIFEENARIYKPIIHGTYTYYRSVEVGYSDLTDIKNVEDYNLCRTLITLDYISFFHADWNLLLTFTEEFDNDEPLKLFLEVKDSFPGLLSISKTTNNNKFTMHFNTNAKLNALKSDILEAHYAALK